MKGNNLELYDEVNKVLKLSTKEFSEVFCRKSESYIRVLRKQNRSIPTEVLMNIFDELSNVCDSKSLVKRECIDNILKGIAKEIALRNKTNEHLKLRKMLVDIVNEINEQRNTTTPAIIIC